MRRLQVVAAFVISIHAPVKGATDQPGRDGRHDSISIHAPVKGATGLICSRTAKVLFQSTLP